MTMDERNDIMTDADLMDAIQALSEQEQTDEMKELLKMMNDSRIISWQEAEQIMSCSNHNGPIKSSLPTPTRPTEPDNNTDVDWSIQQLQMDNPKLKQVNLNNMKRTPIPQVKRLLAAIKNNTHLEKIALANMGLYDHDCEPIFEVVTSNTTLKSINLETNYLSGDFFARLFKAALVNQTLEEVKAVNQGVSFATAAEKEIIDAVFENRGLTKVSINLRLPEGRYKIENALIRNQEIRRILRRQAAASSREVEKVQQKSGEVHKSADDKGEKQSRAQRIKPAVLTSAAKQNSVPPRIVSDSRQTSTNANSNSAKVPPVTAGSAIKNDRKTIPANCKEENDKVPDGISRNIINKSINESFHKNDPMKIRTSEKTELKNPSTKIIGSTMEEISGKMKSNKALQKKISLEQAVPEMELDTEEVARKISTRKKSSLAQAIKRNDSLASEKEMDSTAPIRKSSTRRSSIVPSIFLTSEEKNGPVKRNFSIPSKKNSSVQLEKIAAKSG